MSTTRVPAEPALGAKKAEPSAQGYQQENLESGIADLTLMADVWPYFRPQKFWLTIALCGVVVTAGLALLRPLIMLWTIDQGLESQDPQVMLRGGAIFALVMVAEQAINFLQVYATQVVGARAMAELRLAVFRFLSQLPLKFFDQQPVGRLVTRVTNDVDSIQELFASGALNALGDLIRLVGVVVIMLSLDWKLSLVGFAAMPLIGVVVYLVRSRARRAFRQIRGETARMNANMNEQVGGMALIQAYGRQLFMAEQFDDINSSYRDANMRSVKYDSVQDASIDALSSISLASLVVALGYYHASFGTVVALSLYLKQFFEPISMLAQRFTLLQAALSGAERVFGLLRYQQRDAPLGLSQGLSPHDSSSDEAKPEGTGEGSLQIENITFGYKQAVDVLVDVSLHANKGEMVALVGPTGSGKSTIVAMLLRLYEWRSGRVFVDGKNARSLSRDELRSLFSVVPQDVYLFPGTLAQNVAIGQTLDRKKVEAVFAELGIDDLFLRHPAGLDRPVEAVGGNFSAGERQLIAFARALYRDAPYLILDEATANVDSGTEARMQAALVKLMEGRTTIVVAHRLSTIRSADRIVVLQQGHVVESGTHDELMESGGLYAALHQLQLKKASN